MNGFSSAGTTIGSSFTYTLTTSNGDAQAQLNLSGITAFQNVPNTTTITMRLYGWGASAATGTGALGRLTGNDLSIGGTVNAAPLYWDLNGTTSGVGGAGPAEWNTTSSRWNSDATGVAAPGVFVSSSTAVFGGTAGFVDVVAVGITANAGIQFDSSGYTINGGGGSITVGTTNTIAVTTAGHTATINAGIAGTNGLNKTGSGELVLGATSNFTGNVSISAGTLSISAAANLGDLANDVILNNGTLKATGAVTLASGRSFSGSGGALSVDGSSLLDIQGDMALSGGLTLSDAGGVILSGTSKSVTALTFSTVGELAISGGDLVIGSPRTVTANNTSGTAVISGASAVDFGAAGGTFTVATGGSLRADHVKSSASFTTKLGSGTLSLPNANPNLNSVRIGLAGATSATGGVVSIGNAQSLGTGSLLFNNGTLHSASAVTIANELSIGGGQIAGGAVFDGDIKTTGVAALFKPSSTTIQHEITVNSGRTVEFAGNINASAGSGTSTGLTKSGSGTLIFSGATNSMAEAVTIAAGTLQIGRAGASGALGSGGLVNNSNLAFNRTGSATFSNAVSGTGNVYQNGGGVISLDGSNTYQGTTTVSAGTLRVNGTHTGGGAYTVASGATLGGGGSTASAVTIQSGGTLSPGNSIGDISVGTIQLDPNAVYSAEVKTTPAEASDRTLVTGASGTTVTLGDGLDFPVLSFAFTAGEIATFAPGKAFVIIQNESAGTITGRFKGSAGTTTTQNVDTTSVTDDGLLSYILYYGNYAGSNLVYGTNSGGNDLVVEFTSVPEPATLAAIGLAAGLMGLRRRRC